MSDTYTNPIERFIFGGGAGSGTLSWEQLQARRKIAAALAARRSPYPKTIGEGLTYAGEKFGDVIRERGLAEDERIAAAYDDSIRRSMPGMPTAPSPAAPGPAISGVLPGAEPPTPPASQPPMPPQRPPQPMQPMQPQMQPQRPTQPPGAAPVRMAAPPVQAELDRAYADKGVSEEDRPYFQTLGYGESKFDPNARSKTNAAGVFQFVPGTAKQYGLTGKESDPYSNASAAIDLTNDNRALMTRQLGRPPTHAELALAHNQGAQTAVNMITGRANASARNLAVNGVPAGAGPQDAAAFLQNKLGFGGGGDPRRDIAASLTAAGTPPPAAAGAGAGPAAAPQPRVQLASASPGAPPQAAPPPLQGVAQAPPVPTPNQRVAQAPRSPAADVLGPLAPDREAPTLRAATPEEAFYRLHANNDRLSPTRREEFKTIADQYQKRREAEHAQALEMWKLYKTERAGEVGRRQTFDLGYGKQQSELAAAQQKLLDDKIKAANIGDDKSLEAIRALPGNIERTRRIQDFIDKGAVTGLLGPVELFALKTRAAVGGAPDPRIAITERLKADLAAIAGTQRLDVVGPGAPSNKDMELLQDAAAGRITLDGDTIREVARISERLQLSNALFQQRKVEQFAKENPELADIAYARYGVQMENVVSPNHPAVQRLFANADNPDAIRQFNEKFHTPGLAERLLTRRPR